MKDCPQCRLGNPDSALRCDCGFDFPSRTMQKERLVLANTEAHTAIGHITDAIFLFLALDELHTSHLMPTFLVFAIPVTCYGALSIWRWHKYLLTRWRRLI